MSIQPQVGQIEVHTTASLQRHSGVATGQQKVRTVSQHKMHNSIRSQGQAEIARTPLLLLHKVTAVYSHRLGTKCTAVYIDRLEKNAHYCFVTKLQQYTVTGKHEMYSSVQSQVKQTEVHTLLLRDKSASVFSHRSGRKYTLLLRDKDRAVWSGSKRVVNFPWQSLRRSREKYFRTFGVSLRETNRQKKSSFEKRCALDLECRIFFSGTFRWLHFLFQYHISWKAS